jgi:hypothetical protein
MSFILIFQNHFQKFIYIKNYDSFEHFMTNQHQKTLTSFLETKSGKVETKSLESWEELM